MLHPADSQRTSNASQIMPAIEQAFHGSGE